GQSRAYMARLDPTTGLADSLNPQPSGGALTTVYAIAVQADGKVLVGGDFTTLAPNGGTPVTRNRIARLERDGRLDQTLNLSMGGQTRNHIARLFVPDGSADSFDPNINGSVYSITVQADGNLLVAGNFTTVTGAQRNHIARLNGATGSLDVYDPNANNSVFAI